MATEEIDQQMSAAFEELSALENEFADVELDALRRKEHALAPLYNRRSTILTKIPNFWTEVFLNAPEQIQQLYSSTDVAALAAIRDFKVERYQLQSATEGEPRSLRFTFEFDDNENFGKCTLVKEFEYRPAPNNDGPGNLVSKAVPIKWKNKKSDLTKGMLDLAVELEASEHAMKVKKGSEEIDLVEREGLWQYAKLREAIEKSQEASEEEPTFLNWFGFRGAVEKRSETKKEANGENGEAEDEDEDEWEDGMLDVEIFPAGEEVAIALAEELYPEAIDVFMQAQEDDDEDDIDIPDFDGIDSADDDEEAPELVKDEDDEPAEADQKRPSKRQRTD